MYYLDNNIVDITFLYITLPDGRRDVVLHIGVRINAYNDHPQGRIQLFRMVLSPLHMVGLSPQKMQR